MTHIEAIRILDELLALEEGLSEWELTFIESLDSQRRSFSDKQVAVLEKLEARLLK